ncbi:MAG: hypothetical protein BWY82_01974 [Verrucomicrobia bacterium ADurb.Bin474]|nr:MAG: hypothetical protein BWY82_01974 [Verrucomicrobia bacterium ADurb.Bin474]
MMLQHTGKNNFGFVPPIQLGVDVAEPEMGRRIGGIKPDHILPKRNRFL